VKNNKEMTTEGNIICPYCSSVYNKDEKGCPSCGARKGK